MWNVRAKFLRVFLPAICIIATGCNPLVSKTSIDTNFAPGLGTSAAVNPIVKNSTVVVSTSSLAANGVATVTVTVTLIDGNGTKVPNKIVVLSTNRGASDVLSSTAILTDALGMAVFTATSTLAGTATFTAKDSTDGLILDQTASVTYLAGTADHLVAVAGNGSSAKISAYMSADPKVQVVDYYGNGVSTPVDLSFICVQGGGQITNLKVTSDTSGYASTPFIMGPYDTSNVIEVKKIGTQLPALNGSASIKLTNTATHLGTGSFSGKMPATAGGGTPYTMATGDFNGDGKQDVAVGQTTTTSIGIFLGNGDGTFANRVDIALGFNPYRVATKDINADSKLDLVAVSSSNKVMVLIGDGAGGFAAPVNYNTTLGSLYVAIEDLNGDGANDLAVTNSGSNTVTIFIGNKTLGVANGTFAAGVDYATHTGPYDVYAKDVNNDGFKDLITSNYNGNSISVLINSGTGTFPTHVEYTTANGPISLDVGDFNADGATDLAVATWSGPVSVLLGNKTAGVPDGTFAAKVDYTTGSNARHIVVKDVNSDGALDLVASLPTGNAVTVYLGNKTAGVPNGTFAAHVDYTAGYSPYALAMADFDGDGKDDITFVGNSTNFMGFLKNVGDGTFRIFGQSRLSGGSAVSYSTSLADVNADGATDIIATNYNGTSLSVYIANKSAGVADGTFQAAVNYTTGSNPYNSITGDFDEDGAIDIAVTNYSSSTVSIFKGNKTSGVPNGTFQAKVDYAVGTNPKGIVVGDFNKDGHLDLVTSNITTNNLTVLQGAGNGTFSTVATLATGGSQPIALAVADLNSDGNHDIITADYSSAMLRIFMGNGNGTFQAVASYAAPAGIASIAIADVDADGKLDILSVNISNQSYSFFKGNGDGTVAAYVATLVGTTNPSLLKTGDLNGDGKLDLVVGATYTHEVEVFYGNGNGTFQSKIVYQGDTTPTWITLGDLNGDGKLDIVNTASSINNVYINFAK